MLTLFCKQIDDERLKSGCTAFKDVLDVWLAETRGSVKRSTLATYTGACERYIRPGLGSLPTEQMTDEQISKFLRESCLLYTSSEKLRHYHKRNAKPRTSYPARGGS